MTDLVELWCPGPSLQPHTPESEWVVTVNRAAIAWWDHRETWHALNLADNYKLWAVARDLKPLRGSTKDGPTTLDDAQSVYAAGVQPNAITSAKYNAFQIGRLWPGVPYYPFEWMDAHCGSVRWRYTKVVAMCVAHQMIYQSRGGGLIRIYGDDMTDRPDWDGVLGGANRKDERWKMERDDTEQAVALFKQRGCEVEWMK